VGVPYGTPTPFLGDQFGCPEPRRVLESIGLDLSEWHIDFLGLPERELTGPENKTATVKDRVLAFKKK